METFQDFFKELRDRASNPLFSSFLIAWLVFNWPIPIGLIFYEPVDLKADGFDSYFKMIKGYYDNMNMIVYPTVVSLFYTFVFPYITARIKLIHANITAKNESDILKGAKGGQMPVMKYIKLRDESHLVIERLNALIESESQLMLDNTSIKEEVLTLKQEIDRKDEQIAARASCISHLELTSQNSLIGSWNVTIESPGSEPFFTVWKISRDMIHIEEETFLIDELIINPFTRRIAFRMSNQLVENFSILTYFFSSNEECTILRSVGSKTKNGKIVMRKIIANLQPI